MNEFIDKAKKQDSRNSFEKYDGNLSAIPEELRSFYKNFNPVDVEVSMKDTSVRFFPVDKLNVLQNDYKLPNTCFVFASSNGDPIYIEEGKIKSGVFGKEGFIPEVLAESFLQYISMIDFTAAALDLDVPPIN